MKLVCFAACAVAAALSGCASTKSFVQAKEASADAALFYFVRMHYPPTAWTGELVVNGKVVAEVKDNSCVRANVPAGKAEIGLKFGPMLRVSDETFTLDARPNQTRYLLMTGDVAYAGMNYSSIIYNATFKVIELPTLGGQTSAADLIKQCQ